MLLFTVLIKLCYVNGQLHFNKYLILKKLTQS